MITVTALYIDPRGPYPRMSEVRALTNSMVGGPFTTSVDCWDESRDARLYDGPHPVVAHPPCRHWSKLSHQAHVQCSQPGCTWHGPLGDTAAYETQRCPSCFWPVTSDRDCAIRAVEQVRRFGGVLEHPAGSKLWEHPFLNTQCLPDPTDAADDHGGYTIEVDQVGWGHVARKRTWLYLVGVPRSALEDPPFPGREPTHWCSGFRRKGSNPGESGYKATGCAVPPGIKVASAQQRRRTPPLFAEYLVRLARSVKR